MEWGEAGAGEAPAKAPPWQQKQREDKAMPEVLSQPPAAWADARVDRPPLLVSGRDPRSLTDLRQWEEERAALLAAWRRYLGAPPFPEPPPDVRTVEEFDLGRCTGRLLRLRTEPEYEEAAYLLVPKGLEGPAPAVLVFYYDVDTPAGHDLGSPHWRPENTVRRFARHLALRGYVALAMRWAYEGFLEALGCLHRTGGLQARYAPAVERMRRLAPNWKGLGRVVWDAGRAVDYLVSLPYVDPRRIACLGHSLGGKMALYAAAFDTRIRAAVSSEPGIGLSFSNWDALWYLGPEVRDEGFPLDHHQLLALLAPRPFLLIAGEDADGDRSWAYLNTARPVYGLYGAAGPWLCNHRSGHTPTWEALDAAYRWLDVQLGHRPATADWRAAP